VTLHDGGSPGWPGRGSRLPRLSGLPVSPAVVAPTLSLVGLALVAALSYGLLVGQLPTVGGGSDHGGQGGPVKTPTPSNVVVVDPRADVPGQIVYVKDGNLWIQSGATVRQVTTGGSDTNPAWSADGQWIYFVRTTPAQGKWPANGQIRTYDLDIPALVRIHPDGTGLETILSGKVKRGSYTWASFIRQPSPSPDGKKVAIITDGPDPSTSDLLLKIVTLATGNLVNPGLTEFPPLGHQDPAWSPDGSAILYVRDARSGTRGTPVINRYDLATGKVRNLTGAGYISPAWSPDGQYVAATKTGSFGTDVVILDAGTGAEVLRLTNDEVSFDPVWSPAGDSIAFFRVDQGVVDLELVHLTGTAPTWGIGDTISLTVSAGLEAGSRASWYIPPEELPTPAPTVPSSAQPFPTLHASATP
jgi:Tol biopolymer transport system component